jgi:hypothetical protein|tara:strand:- start:95 stop:655 length:561 start_codon:yes stop_codon:yes gene_type:complete
MARTFKKTDLAIDNSEVKEIVKELKQYGKKDVLKTLAKFHREIAKEQLQDSRVLARKQPVPKANKSAMGFTASGTRSEAKINIKTSDRYPSALSMEFGRRFQYVPTRRGGTRAITQAEIGRLPHSRPGAKFPYRKWIGNNRDRGDSSFTKLGKQGYVVGKTISRNQNEILETYNDRLYDALTKAIK